MWNYGTMALWTMGLWDYGTMSVAAAFIPLFIFVCTRIFFLSFSHSFRLARFHAINIPLGFSLHNFVFSGAIIIMAPGFI